MVPSIFPNFFEEKIPCECCAPRYVTGTFTTHKWTRKEVEEKILYLVGKLNRSNWFTRGDVISALRHWQSKLDKLTEVEEEFDLRAPKK